MNCPSRRLGSPSSGVTHFRRNLFWTIAPLALTGTLDESANQTVRKELRSEAGRVRKCEGLGAAERYAAWCGRRWPVRDLFRPWGGLDLRDFCPLSTANPIVVHLVVTPLVFVLIGWLTVRYAPQSTGSGIPQVIAASHAPHSANSHRLVSIKVAIAKALLTFGGLFGGASVGREGPTVQLAAAIMLRVHRLFNVRITPGIYIAGGAAGVAAAFNTPLAGIAFAIEELAVAYEQRVAVLVMGA